MGEQFAHIHNVRLMWLKSAAPELLANLQKIEKTEAHDKTVLRKALTDSGKAIGALINQSAETGKVKGFKPHVGAFVGYLISHALRKSSRARSASESHKTSAARA